MSRSDESARTPAGTGSVAVVVDGLVVRYGELTAVDGLDLQVAHGEVVALLGPNGAGKTTTVETIEGFRRPDAGRVAVLGLDPATRQAAVMEGLGVMLQGVRLYAAIRPVEALRLFAAYYAQPVDDLDALLDRVGLQARARTPWRRLSGGEQQRLALALALVGRPRVVVLDEPTAGLDVDGRLLVREIIRELRDDGVAVLLTTHELDEAERVADRIVVVAAGRVVASGTLAELAQLGGPREHGLWFRAAGELDLAALADTLGGPVRVVGTDEYLAAVTPDNDAIGRLAGWFGQAGLVLLEFRAAGSRLEDVYQRLVEEANR